MSVPANIDVFNRIVATGLLQLYGSFPVPLDLDPRSVAMAAITDDRSDEDLFAILTQQAGAAIDFLAAEGFLRYRSEYQTIGDYTFPQAQLTMKGLAILGAVPEAVDTSTDRRTLAEQLRTAVENGAEESLSQSVSSVLSAAIGIGFRAVVSAASGGP